MKKSEEAYFDLQLDGRGVATITIARSGKLNVLNSGVIENLISGLLELSTDQSLRLLVLAGSGDTAFIGGADLKEMVTLEQASAELFISRLRDLCEVLRQFPVPVIAKIQGWCLGGGLEVAAACDIRVASAKAQFAMPEVQMGIPSVIHAALLPRLIGGGRARWLMLTAEILDSEKALAWGLVDSVAAEQDLDAEVERILAKMLACGSHVLRTQKRLLNAWDDMPLAQSISMSVQAFGESFATGEPTRFMSEFLKKRSRKADIA